MGSLPLMTKILESIRALHLILNISKQFNKADGELLSFDVAHHAGMSVDEEYQLLQYEQELHRQEYVKRHLVKVLEVMTQMDKLKNKIMQNGHFKNLEGFGF